MTEVFSLKLMLTVFTLYYLPLFLLSLRCPVHPMKMSKKNAKNLDLSLECLSEHEEALIRLSRPPL